MCVCMQTNNTKNILLDRFLSTADDWGLSLSSEITIQKAVIRNNVCRLFLFAFVVVMKSSGVWFF